MDNDGIVERALRSLGKGFDLTSDFRLRYSKGEERLVLLNETERRTLRIPGFGAISDVSIDIKCDKGERSRYQSDILEFSQMSEFFNRNSGVPGKVPTGMFNAMFGFQSNSWSIDAANTKNLGLDGYFMVLFNLRIQRSSLLLSDEVRSAVPSSWDPLAISRFIDKYGTHVIVGLGIGGQDVVLVKQDRSSNLGPSDLKNLLDDLGDQLFTGACTFSPLHNRTKESKSKAPKAFDVFDPQSVPLNGFVTSSSKDGITVICSKKGGDSSVASHYEWLLTVPSMPDAIHFNFVPITSLLKGVPGSGFLSHAINLYLRYKPPIDDLAYFLDFQTHKHWAPIHNDLPLGPTTNRATSLPSLHFNLMGPKLYINTSKVMVGKIPVTGMRFFLEGRKCNRLALHLQHLAGTPAMLLNKIEDSTIWRGSEENPDHRYFEPVQGKKFSHICMTPVTYQPEASTSSNDIAHIVTGAQLHVKKHNSKNVLHLRLQFSAVSDSFIAHSTWDRGASENSTKSGLLSVLSTTISGNTDKVKKQPLINMDSSVYPDGPPMPIQTQKLLKFVDTSEHCRGPQHSPGHWLVTGAKLDLDRGKICIHVKFSLLNMSFELW